MSNFLTIHTIFSLPWSNVNRDDTGTPKHLLQGGVLRSSISSQAIKRQVRISYEQKSRDISVRSGNLAELIGKRSKEINPDLEIRQAVMKAGEALRALVKSEKASVSRDVSDTGAKSSKKSDEERRDSSNPKEQRQSIWLSAEEIETCAAQIASEESGDFIEDGKTGSLAIAAFGRMFAKLPSKNTEAAIAVSPAVSTHAAAIETDYFSTVDDYPNEKQGAGSTYLGTALYTSGCFYRTATIDKAQLHRSWTGFDRDDSITNLRAMIDALIYALPSGKKNVTAPYVVPALVLAEEQAHRIAYDFENPVQAAPEGGYVAATIQRLQEQFVSARRFDPDNFRGVAVLSGSYEDLDSLDFKVCAENETQNPSVVTKNELIDQIISWIRK